MFLYAAAYAFSKKLGYNLLIDDETGIIHDFKKCQKRRRINWKPNYELSIFNLQSEIAGKEFKFLTSMSQIKRKYIKFFDTFHLKNKILFAGIDLISNYLTGDINVTSPTGLKNYKDLTGIDLSINIWNCLESRL